jgi:bifunctional non-homologous end joining protein LigD
MKSNSTATGSKFTLPTLRSKYSQGAEILDEAFRQNRFGCVAHCSRLAIIDGEVVAPADDGTTDFSVLQNELKGRSTKIALVAFDLLYLNGRDLRQLPLRQRKALLKSVIAETDIQFSESFEVDGPEMFKHACKTGLEGVVSKVRDSSYPQGRSNDWVKVTCRQRETLPIAGFAMKANRFDGIYIGRRRGDELIYAGKVDHDFTPDDANTLQDRLKPLIRKSQPYKKRIAHKGVWRIWDDNGVGTLTCMGLSRERIEGLRFG